MIEIRHTNEIVTTDMKSLQIADTWLTRYITEAAIPDSEIFENSSDGVSSYFKGQIMNRYNSLHELAKVLLNKYKQDKIGNKLSNTK